MKKLLFLSIPLFLLGASCTPQKQEVSITYQTQPPAREQSDQSNISQITDTKTIPSARCTNTKYGYQFSYPENLKVYTPGKGEARLSNCSENLANYFFTPDLYGPLFHNQFNLDVYTSENQTNEFWSEIDSVDSFLKKRGFNTKIDRRTTVDGETLIWLKPETRYTSAGAYTETRVFTYHAQTLYDFTFFSMDQSVVDDILISFKFLK